MFSVHSAQMIQGCRELLSSRKKNHINAGTRKYLTQKAPCRVSLQLCVSVPCLYFPAPLTVHSPGVLSALAPDTGVAVYAGLVGALLLCMILVLCVGVLAYRRRCRHLHGDITDSSSALTAAFHPGNYKPSRQGRSHTHTHTRMH